MKNKTTPIGAITIPGTDIHYAPAIKAGHWVFLTGIEAADYGRGLHDTVRGNPEFPLHGLPKHRREGDFICARLSALLKEAGTSFANTVRLDQYYPTWKAVDPYHLARRAAFGDYIPPSTSIIMEELLTGGADITTSVLAVVPGDGREPKRVPTPKVTAPVWSGFVPAVTSGDFIFVAGQMARGADGNADPRAHVPPHSLWGGYEIRRQTEYLVREKFVPALEAAGSSLRNAVKAQVYLRHMEDLPHFLDVWESHFGARQCALTIVPGKDFGLVPGNIEINLVALTDNAGANKRVIDGCIPREMSFGAAAVRAGDLLFCSGLTAVDAAGAIAAVKHRQLEHLGVPARAQMQHIVDALKAVCAAGGTSLENVVRVHQFHTDLGEFYPMHRAWQEALGGAPVPFTAVGVHADLPVPSCSVVVDPWFYAP
ncbi:MAG TPA: Rid family hydrolase [Burkholderiales bacterium]|nr:Rid family hydrolase [Burkholderiales bacterium]